MARRPRTRRRERKSVPVGRAYIQSTFNNTLVTLTDSDGNVLAWGSAGTVGFPGRASRPRSRRRGLGRMRRRRVWNTVCGRSRST